MKFCSSSVTHAALETDTYTLALFKHPFLKYHRDRERTLHSQQASAAINTVSSPLLLPACSCAQGAGEEAGKGREGAGWGSQLPQQHKQHSQSENLFYHCLVLSHLRKSHAALTLPFPKRAEPSTSEIQSGSSGYLFILVTDLRCVNSESI